MSLDHCRKRGNLMKVEERLVSKHRGSDVYLRSCRFFLSVSTLTTSGENPRLGHLFPHECPPLSLPVSQSASAAEKIADMEKFSLKSIAQSQQAVNMSFNTMNALVSTRQTPKSTISRLSRKTEKSAVNRFALFRTRPRTSSSARLPSRRLPRLHSRGPRI
jgi:hypothetical protein